jgi:hypothetical protein
MSRHVDYLNRHSFLVYQYRMSSPARTRVGVSWTEDTLQMFERTLGGRHSNDRVVWEVVVAVG